MSRYETGADRVRFWTEDARVQAIIGNVADGVIGIDSRGRIEMFNPAAEQLFGYNADEVLGLNVKCLAAAPYQANHDQYLENYLKSGERKVIGIGREVRGQRKDGSTFPMYLSVGELKFDGFHGFVGIAHDLSELHLAQQERDQARLLMQGILNAMPSVVVGVAADLTITHWNESACKVTGMAADDALGSAFVECFPHLAALERKMLNAVAEGVIWSQERFAVPGDGDVRFVDLQVYPLAGDAGAAVRIDDVSERVRIEDMMIQTEKMLSVGGLAAGMAHEINNPLGIIAQGCQNLERRLSDQLPQNREVASALGLDLKQLQQYMEQRGIKRFLSGIREAVQRSAHIVSDMLAYSRRSASSFEPTRMTELVEATLRLASHDYDLKKSYDFRRIEIIRDFQASDDELLCDRTAIEQVLLNLVKNAAQAMTDSSAEREPQLQLRLQDDGAFLRIEVVDNGPGMDNATTKRVFEPFFTTKPVGVGTGLGLSVAYFIVTEQHQGTLQVDTPAEGGTCFVIRLPRGVTHANSGE